MNRMLDTTHQVEGGHAKLIKSSEGTGDQIILAVLSCLNCVQYSKKTGHVWSLQGTNSGVSLSIWRKSSFVYSNELAKSVVKQSTPTA